MGNTSMCMVHSVGKLVECKVYSIIVMEQNCVKISFATQDLDSL